jgi:hypothetical protein
MSVIDPEPQVGPKLNLSPPLVRRDHEEMFFKPQHSQLRNITEITTREKIPTLREIPKPLISKSVRLGAEPRPERLEIPAGATHVKLEVRSIIMGDMSFIVPLEGLDMTISSQEPRASTNRIVLIRDGASQTYVYFAGDDMLCIDRRIVDDGGVWLLDLSRTCDHAFIFPED